MIRQSSTDTDGVLRWADTYLGSEEWYAIDCGTYLTEENDTLSSVAWTVPTGLTELSSETALNIAHIKLRADTVGVYIIEFALNSVESGNTQKTIERIRLVVL